MILLAFIAGFAPLMLIGWLCVRTLEGASAVLTKAERFVYGAILGPTVVMEVVFLLNAAHILRLHLIGYLAGILLLLLPLGFLEWKRRSLHSLHSLHSLSSSDSSPTRCSRSSIIILSLLGFWLLLKFAAGMTILMSDPAYNDDVFNNWHYRAKVLHHEEALVLVLPGTEGQGPGISAYPPTVPMIKVWLAIVRGQWNDHLAALTSPFWYLLALAFVFFTLKRYLGNMWGALGVYILGSLPLFLVHGSTPYADLFVALHISTALVPLYAALRSSPSDERSSWLRIGALSAALLPMTKNEALLMHLPPILLLAATVIGWSAYSRALTVREARNATLWYIGLVAAVLIPWLSYKWANGLPFGNAKGISGMEIVWQPHVLRSLWITYVLEANFLLLPGLLLGLLCLRPRAAFRSPAVILTAFTLVALLGLIGILLFTGLSTEALRQTGSARGIVQLLPIIVILVTILLRDMWNALEMQSKEQRG